jgi:hypothetical protein
MHEIMPQYEYAAHLRASQAHTKEFAKQLSPEQRTTLAKFLNRPESFEKGYRESRQREDEAKKVLKEMIKQRLLGKTLAGVTSGTGFNFYDLRPPVELAFPVNTPLRNEMTREGRVNDGYGVMANWKLNRDPGVAYPGVPEGIRAQQATPDELDMAAAYKELGIERAVTFTAQFAGEGFVDNLADEHLRGLFELWLEEESFILLGNPGLGVGNNGFAVNGAGGGTATPTPTTALSTAVADGSLSSGSTVTVYVVALTGLGYPVNSQYGYTKAPTVALGLTPSYTYQSPGTNQTVTINCGTSKISAAGTQRTTSGPDPSVVASIDPINGVFGYAWFVSLAGSPSLATAYLYKITTLPSVLVNSAPGTGYAGNSAGLGVDNSYNQYDFPGLLTYAATTPGAYWKNLLGAGFTSQKNGRVTEVENALEYIWENYQAGPSQIIGSVDAIVALDSAVKYGTTSAPGGMLMTFSRDENNQLVGGFVVSGYQSRYGMNPTGAGVIPIRIHPMMPAGTLYFDVRDIPYPHSRAPYVRGLLVQRDYYSIEWPLVQRQWTFGTYVHETLRHNFPWIPGVLTGIGPFTQST